MPHRRFATTPVALLLLALASPMAFAAPGTLDPSFGAGGMVTTDLYGGAPISNSAHALLLQPDGRLVAVGESSYDGFRALRYDPSGGLDPSFGTGGIATADVKVGGGEYADAAVLQPDGKIVAAGYGYSPGPTNYALARFQSDGSLDPSFGVGGIATTSAAGEGAFVHGLALQPDGKLVTAGSHSFTVARFLADGTLDPAFGTGGVAQAEPTPSCCDEARAIALQPDGKILVAGLAAPFGSDDFGITRLESDGTLDASFGDAGHVIIDLGSHDEAFALAVQPDGKILVAGHSGRRFALVRLLSDGSFDSDFGSGGRVLTVTGDPNAYGGNQFRALTLQLDGKIVAAGKAFIYDGGHVYLDYAIVRYLPDGTLDTTFGFDGIAIFGAVDQIEYAEGVVVQPDAKIAIAGLGSVSNGFGLARVIGGDLVRCSPTPLAGCHTAKPSAGNMLTVRDGNQSNRDRIAWRWYAADTMTLADFGDPTATDDYALCIYDESSSVPVLRFEGAAPGGVACSFHAPCWQRGARRFAYRDRTRLPDGLDSVALQEGGPGKAKAIVVARGTELGQAPLGMPPLPLALPARVQLQRNQGACLEATYSAGGVRRNDGGQFSGSAD